ncbi:ABC transporter ATP-binding protein [Francisella philomiragia]|uniref:ABC transporter ATP-binding protein n=1 Tax=Francisella philomiragia TaxID=28110 RepID=A0ABS1GA46_9GAMM|nr:ABC transporter ATP-binding protein [Francisella philomiragia]MBK2257731.1 ABC transporter ATP-binding protein [Francisella philomiragia]MBK2267761.1 ABC transporter ATP-binding protein [Francisella philomiragia]MBK2279141.1 ABC transporter ATP-binding protein [Francisella philomiragia]MBK2287070.1 ABC transporter ATP-binding protein [Francisella philomiragia]MBK2288973.1 ABC transporter ATP-binding protein [Francisella philomiragia]
MKRNIAIKLTNVSKYYKIYDSARDRVKEAFSLSRKKYSKDFCAVKDVNLEINKGEVLGIFGLNGAGKSTLLKIIAGVVTPTSGRVNVNGQINAMLEITGSVNPELTGAQNIKYSLDLNKVNENERDQITREIIEFAEIGDYINQPVKNYSSGMTARLGFGIATAIKPEILIVDEVLAVGDAIFQNKCFVKIRQLLKGGTTVVFVSHNVSLMVEFCSRAIFLHNRQILLDDEPKRVAHYYQKALFSDDKERVIREIQILNGDIVEEADSDVKDNFGRDLDNLLVSDLCIYDMSNNATSFLETGYEYILSMDVKFLNDYNKVKVDFDAQDITGKTLTLFNSFSEGNILEGIKSGDVFNISNIFKCVVYKGQYTIRVSFTDISDKRFDTLIESNKIEIKFEVGVLEQENVLKIQKHR